MAASAAPTSPVGRPDVTYGLPGFGGLLADYAESVPDLQWPESVRTYGRMRRDPKITAVLRAYFLPITRATWAVDPAGVGKAEAVDLLAADLGLPVLGEKKKPSDSPIRGFRWKAHVATALLSYVYGHMPTEKWWTVRDGRTHLAGWQERLPHTMAMIDVGDDGQIRQVEQNTQVKPIAANRLVWYANEREGANWAGSSLIRACYTPWLLKHEVMKTHAISHRRWGMGVPVVHAPPGATPAQIEEARRLAAGYRGGDQAGVGMPDGYSFEIAGMTGSTPDAVGFLRFLNEEISGSALAGIIDLGQTPNGSRALGDTFLDLFLLALQSAADAIGDTATWGDPAMPGVSRALVDYNWGEDEACPRIVAADVGDRHEITAASIQMLVASGAIQADDTLETYVRDAWGLPGRKTPRTPPPAPPGAAGPPGEAPPGPGPGQPAGGGGGATQPSPAGPAEPPAGEGGNMFAPLAAAGPGGLRRPLTQVEAASGIDPEAIRAELEAARDRLLARWAPVLAAQRADLADQVSAAVDDGRIAGLAGLRAGDDGGTDLLYQAMREVADAAARRMIAEAAGQGVPIDRMRVDIDQARLRQLAAARAAMAGVHLSQQASRRALQVVTASAGTEAAQKVTVTLAGLSPVPLADELMAALHAAVNEARFSVLDAGPEAVYTASEILDKNTCASCAEIDGHQFANLADARGAYPVGAYAHCAGQLRCRGTVIATWEHPAEPAAVPDVAADAEFERKHPRGYGGKFGRKTGPGPAGPGIPAPGERPRRPSRTPARKVPAGVPWTADGDIARYSGSLGIDRADMPQLSGTGKDGAYHPAAETRPAFIARLQAKGIKVTAERVPAGTLKPTQATGDMRAITGIAADLRSGKLADTKTIFVSADGRVIDGHHNWAGRLLADAEGGRRGLPVGMPVQRVDLPAAELLGEAAEFARDQGIGTRKTGEFASPEFRRPPPATGRPRPADTMAAHTDADGNWTPQRAALHRQIIDGILAGQEPQDHPAATFLGGGSASGKGRLGGDGARIDSDAIKAQLPEYQQMLDAGDPRAAAYTHEESSAVAKQAMREAQEKRYNYVLDGTGDSAYAKLAGKVTDARARGYRVEAKYATVDTETAIERARHRAARTGRMVPPSVIRETHAAVTEAYERAVREGLFDHTELYDNNGPKLRKIAYGDGKDFTVTDQAAWERFLDKARVTR